MRSRKSDLLKSATVVSLFLTPMMAKTVHSNEFIPLGYLAGGSASSEALGVAAVGDQVVGAASAAEGSRAFLWSSSGFMQPITPGSAAQAISADGKFVVGSALNEGTGFVEPFRWSETGGFENLGVAPGEILAGPSTAIALSNDGETVVGATYLQSRQQAYRWTEAEGFSGLGTLLDPAETSVATGISGTGNIIVGTAFQHGESVAFKWSSDAGMEPLTGPAVSRSSSATNVSEDGSMIVGSLDSLAGSGEAFRWTDAEGIVPLGFLPNHGVQSIATTITGDGRAILGISGVAGSAAGTAAFVWTETLGMIALKDHLTDRFGLGAELAGWQLTAAMDVSPDGLAIVGRGVNPMGNTEGWLVRLDHPVYIPEPSTPVLATLSVLGLGVGRKRRLAMNP